MARPAKRQYDAEPVAGNVSRRCLLAGAAASLVAPVVALATDGYPRIVQHALGETIIEAPVRRIVTLGYGDEAPALALGYKPVAIARSGMFASGFTPWCEAIFGHDRPLLLDGGEPDAERIASLSPDLILGVFCGMDERLFARLSRIAPTVAFRSGPWRADWQEQTQIVGDALGDPGDARSLTAQTKALLNTLGEAHPGLKGKTFTFATYFPGSGSVGVYLPGETRVDWLLGMGMMPSNIVKDLSTRRPGQVSADISLELLDRLDGDLLIMWFQPGAKDALEKLRPFHLIEPVRRGHYVAFEDPAEVWAMSWPNPLSIPYAFPRFLPLMEKAVLLGT